MCLILYKKKGIDFVCPDIIEEAYFSNNDGFGLMYPDGEGRVIVKKSLEDLNTIQQMISDHSSGDLPIAYHMRFATHGSKDLDNAHPFKVLDKELHGKDMYLMHNGVISIKTWNHAMSDTWHFVTAWFAPIVRNDPSVVNKEWFKKYVSHCIGSGNRLLTMDGDGTVQIFNETAGKWSYEDLWLSNEYYTFSHEKHYRENPTPLYGQGRKRYISTYTKTNYGYGYGYDPYDDVWDEDLKYTRPYGSNTAGSWVQNGNTKIWTPATRASNTNDVRQIIHSTIQTSNADVIDPNEDNEDNLVSDIVETVQRIQQSTVADYSTWNKLMDKDIFEMDIEDLLRCMEDNPHIVAEWICTTLYGTK